MRIYQLDCKPRPDTTDWPLVGFILAVFFTFALLIVSTAQYAVIDRLQADANLCAKERDTAETIATYAQQASTSIFLDDSRRYEQLKSAKQIIIKSIEE